MALVISDGIPLQFYIEGQPTYNEEIQSEKTMKPEYFHQLFNCSDLIKSQFTNTDPAKNYDLVILDVDGNILQRLPFSKAVSFFEKVDLSFSNNSFLTSLAGWNQYNTGSWGSWTWLSGGGALSLGTGAQSQSALFYQGRLTPGINGYAKWPPGNYRFDVIYKNASTGGSAPLQEGIGIQAFNTAGVFGENGTVVAINRGGATAELNLYITTTQEWDYLGIQVFKLGPSSGSNIHFTLLHFDIIENPLDYSFNILDNSFTSSAYDLCDTQDIFQIVERAQNYDPGGGGETTFSIGQVAYVPQTKLYYISLINGNIDNYPPDSLGVQWAAYQPIIARTDCVYLNSSTPKTTLIRYKSFKNFDGIVYNGTDNYFQIRLESRFFHEANAVSSKSLPLSGGKVINSASEIKHITNLELNDLPYYMHTKMLSILSNSVSGSLLINQYEWTLEPFAYTLDSERPITYPLRSASIPLTRKNYVTRNVI